MDEMDPKNPYGLNYEELSYNTKLYYKFNRLKKYVHLSEEDKNILLYAQAKIFLATTGSFTVSMAIAYFLKHRIYPKYIPTLHNLANEYSKFYYALIGASTSTYSYFKYND